MFYFSGVSFAEDLEHMLFLQCFSAATLNLLFFRKRPKKGNRCSAKMLKAAQFRNIGLLYQSELTLPSRLPLLLPLLSPSPSQEGFCGHFAKGADHAMRPKWPILDVHIWTLYDITCQLQQKNGKRRRGSIYGSSTMDWGYVRHNLNWRDLDRAICHILSEVDYT